MDQIGTDMPSTRSEALRIGSKWYFTGKPCKRGHIAKRYTVSCGTCADCFPAIQAAYRKRTRAARSQYNAAWSAANRDKNAAKTARYRARNPERHRLLCLQNRQNNRHKFRATVAERRAAKKRASPPWLTAQQKAQMIYLYREAVLAGILFGVLHQVDHIQPLRGRDRSGLHVPWNLQILTARDNLVKQHKPPD